MQPAALELLGALAGVLDRWGRWYLFGAQAVVAYGAPRFSVRRLLRLLEDALGQSDLLTSFESIADKTPPNRS